MSIKIQEVHGVGDLMRQKLTNKQQNFLDYLEEELNKSGAIPSLRVAAEQLHISHAAVAQFIKTLERKGYLKREGRYSRNIYLLNHLRQPEAKQRWREVPIIGKITAGMPIYAQQEWDGSVVVDGEVYRGQNLFALRVHGDSMKDAGILNEDLVICEPRQYAGNGEIVVALIQFEEATVKRFFLHEGGIELRPENDNYEAVRYPFSDVMVQGKVIGVQRGPEQIN